MNAVRLPQPAVCALAPASATPRASSGLAAPLQLPALLTIADVATVLQVSERQVRNYIAKGELPAVRLGRRGHQRIRPTDLDCFLQPLADATDAGLSDFIATTTSRSA